MNYKEIVLIRHGRPASEHNGRVSSSGFARWVRAYDRSGVHPASHPLCQRDLSRHYSLSSALPRARHSAQRYLGQPADEALALLNEMAIPRYRMPGRLNAWTWVYLNRFYWLCGRRGPFESFGQARRRIREGAQAVIARAEQHQQVVVFGHALTNRFIARYLRQQGWQAVEQAYTYWGVSRFRLS